MTTETQIRALLGEDAANYASNKHRGGRSGVKGGRYEDFFMAYKVIEAAMPLIDGYETDHPHIRSQILGFVDDLRIGSKAATAYYQLRNRGTASWGAGQRSLEDDFALQFKLATSIREPLPTTHIVVPTSQLAAVLTESLPSTIRSHTQVHEFPWTETANNLVLRDQALRQRLIKLSNAEAPTNDVLSGTFCAILAACNEHPEGASADAFIDTACRLFPGQIRLLPAAEDWEARLHPEFVATLDRIQGLAYGAKRGFFYWSGFGTSGIFSCAVHSDEFRQFQDQIVQSPPATFEEFERALP